MALDGNIVSQLEYEYPEEKDKLLKFLFMLGDRYPTQEELQLAGFSFDLFWALTKCFGIKVNWGTGTLELPKGRRICSLTLDKVDDIEEVIIPDGFTTIDSSAFYRCDNLKKVVIPDSVVEISRNSFAYSAIEDKINNPLREEKVYSKILFGFDGIIFSKIPKGVRVIARNAIMRAHTVEKIRIPDSVEYVNSGAFEDCNSLESLVFSKGMKKVVMGTVASCYRLHDVYLPDGITTVEREAFLDCECLEVVHIPKSVTGISKDAFDCSDLIVCTDSDYVRRVFSRSDCITDIRPAADFMKLREVWRL